MAKNELRMRPVQMAALMDAAFRIRNPLTFLDVAMATFRMIGRDADASATAAIGFLYAECEIELLMRLRATWKLGRVRDPESVIG